MQSILRKGLSGAMLCLLFMEASAQTRTPSVEIRTDLGTMWVALYDETPLHRDAFLRSAREGAYDSLLFHHVARGFLVQGGDPESRHAEPGVPLGVGGSERTLPAEIVPGLVHKRGVLGAVRQGDRTNPGKRSSFMQFYIVDGRTYEAADLDRMAERAARHGDTVRYSDADRTAYAREGGTPHLDGAYTVFGEIINGIEVLDAITAVPCDAEGRPLKDIRMYIRILE